MLNRDPHEEVSEIRDIQKEEDVESKLDDFPSQMSSYHSSQTRVTSVASLLAMKREKMEKQRRATILASSEFAKNSKEDSSVNSMLTLNTIRRRSVTPNPI